MLSMRFGRKVSERGTGWRELILMGASECWFKCEAYQCYYSDGTVTTWKNGRGAHPRA